MFSALSTYSLPQSLNQPINSLNVAHTLIAPGSIAQNIRSVRNTDTYCVTISHMDRSYDPISHSRGRKLESIKTAFRDDIKSLTNYNISINTRAYTQLGVSGRQEIKKAMDNNSVSFEKGAWEGKKGNNVLRFNLAKEKGDYRVELAHKNTLNMNTDSLYEFQMNADHAAHDVIFFQVKENGGNMKTSGGGRPPVSLHLKNENEIHIAINSENGKVLREKIAILDCPQNWYNFKVRIVWNREHPQVQVAVNGKSVFETNLSFGAHNSNNHYSKFGIYIPQQKKVEGVKDTSLLFDNVKETHRYFHPKIRPAANQNR
ncbi:hypothetical protein AC791_11970 [Klebsiella sp. RIT-PI-d]|uniref:heparin lyase I family protein n=1 Tax=Klebsiella sp. RIT-PI-d TaxID=1681196 RepID=UPI000676343C|nr:heparin lyase I family protein [Klebsiella sp. RIT-PI-d]KNC09365.1 hypothetical protein AC791_11970 [Klebsiella sp. RIT-PI-d]